MILITEEFINAYRLCDFNKYCSYIDAFNKISNNLDYNNFANLYALYISSTGLSYDNLRSVHIYSTSNKGLVNYLNYLEYSNGVSSEEHDDLNEEITHSIKLYYTVKGQPVELTLENANIDVEYILSIMDSDKILDSLNITSTTRIPKDIIKKGVTVAIKINDGFVNINIEGEVGGVYGAQNSYNYVIESILSSTTPIVKNNSQNRK